MVALPVAAFQFEAPMSTATKKFAFWLRFIATLLIDVLPADTVSVVLPVASFVMSR
jgi:hypothetical protein